MIRLFDLVAVLFAGVAAHLPIAASAPAPRQDSGEGSRFEPRHATRAATLRLSAPPAEVFPLFGPIGERRWAGEHWNPRILYPRPEADVEGTVFTTATDHGEVIWVNVRFDTAAGVAEYVAITPGERVTQVRVTVAPDDPRRSTATVRYTWTALSPEGNEEIARQEARADAGWLGEWETRIEAALAGAR